MHPQQKKIYMLTIPHSPRVHPRAPTWQRESTTRPIKPTIALVSSILIQKGCFWLLEGILAIQFTNGTLDHITFLLQIDGPETTLMCDTMDVTDRRSPTACRQVCSVVAGIPSRGCSGSICRRRMDELCVVDSVCLSHWS
jgi:hypothetical protein